MDKKKIESIITKLVQEGDEPVRNPDGSKPTADDILDMIRERQGAHNPPHDEN